MLLDRATAQGIADGRITTVLRSWDAPRAKAGGTQRTAVGTIRIDGVTEYPGHYRVTDTQARSAGYPDRSAAQAALGQRAAAHIYVITVSFLHADERVALAADADLSADDVDEIARRLNRWDSASTTGPWTRAYLALIAANEAVRAPDLAARSGIDTPRFKRRVRQLKGLGLTLSLDIGYRLSARGKAFLLAEQSDTPV